MLAWNGGALNDVTFGDERPAPTLLPVAPLRSGGYAAFDLIRTRAILFRIERAPEGRLQMRVSGPGRDSVARRVR